MYSPFLNLFVGFLLLIHSAGADAQTRELRVCADPDNMPFSSRNQDGFENRIAALVAHDLSARLTFVWQRMGRGFVREYLDKAQCDFVAGIPTNYPAVLPTSPYYRSTYVFVSRQGQPVPSLDSPVLRGLKIGVQVLDEQYAPPGEALARRGLQNSIVGFDTIGDGADSIVRAVADQKVDLAVVWGPLAGYFARRVGARNLRISPVEPEVDPPGLPFTFAISMAVRRGDLALRDQLEKILVNRRSEIRAILDEYGVPQLPVASLVSAQGDAR
jgi:mxaJ protein